MKISSFPKGVGQKGSCGDIPVMMFGDAGCWRGAMMWDVSGEEKEIAVKKVLRPKDGQKWLALARGTTLAHADPTTSNVMEMAV